jgi:hypothetical protein
MRIYYELERTEKEEGGNNGEDGKITWIRKK